MCQLYANKEKKKKEKYRRVNEWAYQKWGRWCALFIVGSQERCLLQCDIWANIGRMKETIQTPGERELQSEVTVNAKVGGVWHVYKTTKRSLSLD